MPTSQLSIAQLLSAGFESFKKNSGSVVPTFVILETLVTLLAQVLNAPLLNILMIPVIILMTIALVKSFKSPIEKFNISEILSLKDPNLKDLSLKLLWSYIIYIVLIILLCLLLIVPGVIFMIYWYLFAYIVVDQKLSGMAALKKSKELITGHWWKTFGIFLIAAVISVVISATLSSISSQDALIGGLLMSIFSSLISLYFGYVAIAYYFDLKK